MIGLPAFGSCLLHKWLEVICPLTVFQSYQDNERVNMKGLCSAMNKIFKVSLKINYLPTEPNLKSVGRVIANKFYF